MKFKVISHRGNIEGPDLENENKPKNILKVIKKGFDVEVDVWFIKDRLYLGHDEPQHEVNLKFLQNNKLWCHAKNILALQYMLLHNVHCFWHQTDDFTITSKGYLWTYPGKNLTNQSICVMPERADYSHSEILKCSGVCTDYPGRYLR